jgi:hypothetical protein
MDNDHAQNKEISHLSSIRCNGLWCHLPAYDSEMQRQTQAPAQPAHRAAEITGIKNNIKPLITFKPQHLHFGKIIQTFALLKCK